MANNFFCSSCGVTDCSELRWQISAYTLSLHDSEFIHQYVVDTYAAQHARQNPKPITTAFAIIGLYLAVEHNYSGKQVQNAHILLATKSKNWPQFTPPTETATVTVQDVVKVPDTQKPEMIKNWMQAVWETWKPQKAQIEALITKYMKIQ